MSNSIPYFDIAVIAPISSGKSTLLNALLQKELLPVSNEPTTAKITMIQDQDSSESFSVQCRDAQKGVCHSSVPATEKILRQYNSDPAVHYIDLLGNIPIIQGGHAKLRLIDTPGPTNSSDPTHRAMMREVLNSDTDPMILFVLDATKPEDNSEAFLLQEVQEALQKNPKRKILYVLNKLDQLKDEDGETVEAAIVRTRAYLKRLGLPSEPIFPMKAKMAVLLNSLQSGAQLSKRERLELQVFQADPDDFSALADLTADADRKMWQSFCNGPQDDMFSLGFRQSGLTALQFALQDYCDIWEREYSPSHKKEKELWKISAISSWSNGKSTLLNALAGQELLPTDNGDIQSKLVRIFNWQNADGFILQAKAADGTPTGAFQNATAERIESLIQKPDIYSIDISGKIPVLGSDQYHLCLQDIPSIYKARSFEEFELTTRLIQDTDDHSLVLYLFDPAKLDEDDAALIDMIAKAIQKNGKKAQKRFIFVLNKMDFLSNEDESLERLVEKSWRYLKKHGIESCPIVPVSALFSLCLRSGCDLEQCMMGFTDAIMRLFSFFSFRHLKLDSTCSKKEDFYDAAEEWRNTYSLDQIANLTPSCRKKLEEKKHVMHRMLERAKKTGNTPLEQQAQNELDLIVTGLTGLELTLLERMDSAHPLSMRTEYDKRMNPATISLISSLSGGKSTVINALLGQDLLPANNEATTAKITRIYEKGLETGYTVQPKDSNNTALDRVLPATCDRLEELENREDSYYIDLYGIIPNINCNTASICIQEIPSPYNFYRSRHTHREIVRSLIRDGDKRNYILYVMDATKPRDDSDAKLLDDIAQEIRKSGKEAQNQLIFVLNKADLLDEYLDGPLTEFVKLQQKYLKKHQIGSTPIIPLSAQGAKLLRMRENGVNLNRKATAQLVMILCSELDEAAILTPSCRRKLDDMKANATKALAEAQKRNDPDAEEKAQYTLDQIATGIIGLELTIQECLNLGG